MATIKKKIKASSVKPKEEKPEDFIDEMKGDAMMGVIEGILPKLTPMIEKASTKLEDYFGDNTKIFMISRHEGQKPKVIVLSNLKGSYTISNKAIIEGEDEDEEISIENTFTASKSAVVDIHDTGEFVTKLLNGEFTKK